MRIYINGYRIPTSKIKDIGTLNVFIVDGLKIGDYLQIFIPAKDEYIYDLENAKLINNVEIKENEKFREYLKDISKNTNK